MAKYFCITPSMGANFYLSYPVQPAGTPTIMGPSNMQQLGIRPGTAVQGSLNTRWLFVTAGATAITAGTSVNVDPLAFTVGGTGGLSGTPIVSVAAALTGAGLWVEISGATLVAPYAVEIEPATANANAESRNVVPPPSSSGSSSSHRSRAAA